MPIEQFVRSYPVNEVCIIDAPWLILGVSCQMRHPMPVGAERMLGKVSWTSWLPLLGPATVRPNDDPGDGGGWGALSPGDDMDMSGASDCEVGAAAIVPVAGAPHVVEAVSADPHSGIAWATMCSRSD